MKSSEDLEQAAGQIYEYFQDNGRMPSYSEICDLFGYKSKNAAFRLVKKLIALDKLQKSPGGKLVPCMESQTGLKVLGTVQAGFPTPEDEQHLNTVSLDEYLVPKPCETFMLDVCGDSMIDAGILEGDQVIVERNRKPRNGDVVVACVDGDWTIKTYQNSKGKIKLIPGNPNFPVIEPKSELTIGGVVVSVIRKLR